MIDLPPIFDAPAPAVAPYVTEARKGRSRRGRSRYRDNRATYLRGPLSGALALGVVVTLADGDRCRVIAHDTEGRAWCLPL